MIPIHAWDDRNRPVQGDVTWRLADGDFTYFRWQIVGIEEDGRSEAPREATMVR